MAKTVRDVMTTDPITLATSTSLAQAAREMKQRGVGDVLVVDDGELRGIVTDRDIVVRAVAEERDTTTVTLGDVCSTELVSAKPDDAIDDAVRMMRERAIRRLPVVEDGHAVGIVSIGDLAIEQQPESALSDISQAPPNN